MCVKNNPRVYHGRRCGIRGTKRYGAYVKTRVRTNTAVTTVRRAENKNRVPTVNIADSTGLGTDPENERISDSASRFPASEARRQHETGSLSRDRISLATPRRSGARMRAEILVLKKKQFFPIPRPDRWEKQSRLFSPPGTCKRNTTNLT